MYFEKTTASDYPCPCRREARLVPIYLTEAYGCDRCPQMFVLNQEGKLVEQLTAGYPDARAWRWTGEQWKMIYPPPIQENHFIRAIVSLAILLLGWFLMRQWLIPPFSWLYWVVGITIITLVMPALYARWRRRY
ncbi:hypothetical protein IQ266_00225 [filamentous cyanobacterium LEGE 11480]|uniref:Uncharacterized protein n=1 Tax=Romeriopsis navalis LEGE 11480 TaxID=2777977 RepID=A0A928VLS2_9CYAN|nr:hypothetical protein [Romeriopsis navalis]MBE9028179.1 hypothetical protein [Romeriopsis navalis LEGE 11480]